MENTYLHDQGGAVRRPSSFSSYTDYLMMARSSLPTVLLEFLSDKGLSKGELFIEKRLRNA
jgi:hypothetical protein